MGRKFRRVLQDSAGSGLVIGAKPFHCGSVFIPPPALAGFGKHHSYGHRPGALGHVSAVFLEKITQPTRIPKRPSMGDYFMGLIVGQFGFTAITY